VPKQQTSRDKGLTSPSESNLLIHYEDFALAQSVKRELMQLRSRPTIPTSEDVMLIAGRAALTDSSHRAGRTAVDKIRSEACSAICKLAAAIEANTHFIEENQPDAIVNTSLLWARAIDLGQAWMRAGELPRELEYLPTCRDIEVRPIQALSQAPTLAPIPGINAEADASAFCPVNTRAAMVREALAAIPSGSTISFASDDLSFLLGAPIYRCAEAFREVKDLARVRNCSLSFQEEAGTISFHRNETEHTSVDAIRRKTEEDCWHPQRK
jgi:hypothetical protein